MSINIKIESNPIQVRRGQLLLNGVENLKRDEFTRRRKLRLQQVRQQSKDIADKVRKDVKSEQNTNLSNFERKQISELKKREANKLLRLQQRYHDCLGKIGEGHKAAAQQIDAEPYLKEQVIKNRFQAHKRGEEACQKLQLDKEEEEKRANETKERKKYTRTMEDLRSAMLTSMNGDLLASFKKPPLKEISSNIKAMPKKEIIIPKLQINNKQLSPQKERIENVEIQSSVANSLKKEHTNKQVKDITAFEKMVNSRLGVDKTTETSKRKGEETTRETSQIPPREENTVSVPYITEPNDFHCRHPVSWNKEDGNTEIRLSAGPPSIDKAEACKSSVSVSSQQNVQTYDHSSRFIKTRKKMVHVEKMDTSNQPNALELAEEENWQSKNSDASREERLKKLNHICTVRGERALTRERIKKDYQQLLKELMTLSRDENYLKSTAVSGLPKEMHAGDDRLKQINSTRQKLMNAAFEKIRQESKNDQGKKTTEFQRKTNSLYSGLLEQTSEDSPPRVNVAHLTMEKTRVQVFEDSSPESVKSIIIRSSRSETQQASDDSAFEKLMERVEKQRVMLLGEIEEKVTSNINKKNEKSVKPIFKRNTEEICISEKFGEGTVLSNKQEETNESHKNVDSIKNFEIKNQEGICSCKKTPCTISETENDDESVVTESEVPGIQVPKKSFDMIKEYQSIYKTENSPHDSSLESSSTLTYEGIKIIVQITDAPSKTLKLSKVIGMKDKKCQCKCRNHGLKKPTLETNEVLKTPVNGNKEMENLQKSQSDLHMKSSERKDTYHNDGTLIHEPVCSTSVKFSDDKGLKSDKYVQVQQNIFDQKYPSRKETSMWTNNNSTTSTSYFSPPEYITPTNATDIAELLNQLQPIIASRYAKLKDVEINPKLIEYIGKLLGMNRESLDKLSVSSSEVSTPSSDVVKCPRNYQPSKSFEDKPVEIAKPTTFKDDKGMLSNNVQKQSSDKSIQIAEDSLEEISEGGSLETEQASRRDMQNQTDVSKEENECCDFLLQLSEKITQTLDIIQGKFTKTNQNVIDENKQTPVRTEGSDVLDQPFHLSSSSTSGSSNDIPETVKEMTLDEYTKRKFSELFTEASYLTNQCSERIFSLAERINQIQIEKTKIIESSSSEKEIEGNDTWESTKYLSPPASVSAPESIPFDIPTVISHFEDITFPNAFPHTPSDVVDSALENNTADVKKQNKTDEQQRAKPPATLWRNVLRNNIPAAVPHELSTIAEVDFSPHKSVSQKPLEQPSNRMEETAPEVVMDEETINDSDDSIPDIMAEMIKRGLVSKPFEFLTKKEENEVKSKEASMTISHSLSSENESKCQSSKDDTSNISESGIESSDNLDNTFRKLGMSWASAMLRKIKETNAFSSSSSDNTPVTLSEKRIKHSMHAKKHKKKIVIYDSLTSPDITGNISKTSMICTSPCDAEDSLKNIRGHSTPIGADDSGSKYGSFIMKQKTQHVSFTTESDLSTIKPPSQISDNLNITAPNVSLVSKYKKTSDSSNTSGNDSKS